MPRTKIEDMIPDLEAPEASGTAGDDAVGEAGASGVRATTAPRPRRRRPASATAPRAGAPSRPSAPDLAAPPRGQVAREAPRPTSADWRSWRLHRCRIDTGADIRDQVAITVVNNCRPPRLSDVHQTSCINNLSLPVIVYIR